MEFEWGEPFFTITRETVDISKFIFDPGDWVPIKSAKKNFFFMFIIIW